MNISCQLDRSVIPVGQAGEVNLMVRLRAPYEENPNRKPVNIGLVLDVSASMQGDKLEHTKLAVCRIIDHLRPEDVLSVVVFSVDARTIIEPSHPENKSEWKQRIMTLGTRSNTNLSAGWLKGIEKVMFHAQEPYISRVLLLTDGEANEGVTGTPDLVAIGRGTWETRQITTTTIGFGEHFNEDALIAVAKQSGGNYYYIQQADHASRVYEVELDGLLKIAAQNVEVCLSTSLHPEFVAQLTDFPAKRTGNDLTIRLGDMRAGEERSLLIGFLAPVNNEKGREVLASLNIFFTAISGGEVGMRREQLDVALMRDDQRQADAAPLDLDVVKSVHLQVSARARLQAVQATDKGDYDAAKVILEQTVQKMAALPNAEAPVIQRDIADLNDHIRRMHAPRGVQQQALRKSMTESTYRSQTMRIALLDDLTLDTNAKSRRRKTTDRTDDDAAQEK